MEIIIDLLAHFFISIAIGFFLWYLFDRKNKQTFFLCLFFSLLSGFFIDIDHLFDYGMTYGFVWNFYQFISEDYFSKTNYVLFHGFEYVFSFALLAFFTGNKTKRLFLLVLASSLFFHLAVDIVVSRASIKSYFLMYRILTGFTV